MIPDENTLIIMDLLHNSGAYKKLAAPLNEQLKELLLKEDPVFHNEIKAQHKEMLKKAFLNEMVQRLQVNTENAMIIIEDLNFEEYLKC